MTQPFWDDPTSPGFEEWYLDIGQASLWDTAFIAGRQLPGLVSVEGDGPPRKIDVKNGPGLDGATLTFQGLDPAKFTITLVMWTARQWSLWQELLPTLSPRGGKKPPTPLDLAHPAANSMGVKSIVIEKITLAKAGSTHGTREVVMDVMQWVSRPKVVGIVTPERDLTDILTEVGVQPNNPKAPSFSNLKP